MKKIVLVGCGSMGGAILKGFARSKGSIQKIYVIDPNPKNRAEIEDERFVEILDDHEEFRNHDFDMLIFAVKPEILRNILPVYQNARLSPKVIISSVAAGIPISFYGCAFPNNPVLRIMPNTPVAINEGVLGLVGSRLDAICKLNAESILSQLGQVIWVSDDDELDRLTSISGCGPGFVYRFVESLARSAEARGFNRENAAIMAQATVIGALNYMQEENRSAKSMWEEVASPGGMTQEGLNVLDAHLDALMDEVTHAAYRRGLEMRQE